MASSLDGAEDRLNEAHFFLHAMEGSYHQAEPFRFHLNAFLRAIKEVPQLIQMGVQAAPELVAWLRPEVAALRQDPLINYIFDKRDFIVHRDRLLPSSTAFIGITEGRGLKWGISMRLDPTKDSDVLMQAYIITVKANGDVFQWAQLSSSELGLMFYNALHPVGGKSRPLLERYAMFENLDPSTLCNPPDEVVLFDRAAFGDQDLSGYRVPA